MERGEIGEWASLVMSSGKVKWLSSRLGKIRSKVRDISGLSTVRPGGKTGASSTRTDLICLYGVVPYRLRRTMDIGASAVSTRERLHGERGSEPATAEMTAALPAKGAPLAHKVSLCGRRAAGGGRPWGWAGLSVWAWSVPSLLRLMADEGGQTTRV